MKTQKGQAALEALLALFTLFILISGLLLVGWRSWQTQLGAVQKSLHIRSQFIYAASKTLP